MDGGHDMITNRGWLSGVLLMMSGLFWWIAVQNGSDALNNTDIPNSQLGEFDFSMFICNHLVSNH